MERSRQGVTILPLSGLQQSACDEGLHLTSAQLDLDARKPTPATLAIAAHSLGGRGKRWQAITHGDLLRRRAQRPSRSDWPRSSSTEGCHEGCHTLNLGILRRILAFFDVSLASFEESQIFK